VAPSPDTDDKKKEGRMARHSRLAREAWEEPTSILRWSRDWLVRLWITKGAGFYGLGYVITFIALETRSISDDLGGDGDLAAFVASQFVQFIIRFSVESFLNAIFAVIWPVWVLQWLEGWGVVALIAAFIAFRFVVRPSVEAWFPELREAREAKKARKAAARAARAGTEA
jgi:hypothetical protein